MLPDLRNIDIAHPEEWGAFALIAVVAVIGIIALLRVTLRGAGSLGRAALPAKPFKRVLLPAVPEMGYTDDAVTLACRLAGRGSGASVLLTYLIEVPRALAPNTPLPEAEDEARRVLDRAAEAVKRFGLQPVTQVRKSRTALDETLRTIQEERVDLLVLMMPAHPSDPNTLHPLVTLTTELARRAPCEVVLARAVAA